MSESKLNQFKENASLRHELRNAQVMVKSAFNNLKGANPDLPEALEVLGLGLEKLNKIIADLSPTK